MQISTDAKGNSIRFKPYKGLKFHPDIPGKVGDQLKDVSSLVLRSDDVLLCTYPKSGTHWVYNMIQMIRCENLQYSGTPYMLSFHPTSEIDQLDSPRTLHTHLTFPLIPEMARQGKVKIVHVLRNPKDTITSYYQHYKRIGRPVYEGDFNGFLDYFLSDDSALFGGTWFSYVREWEDAKQTNRNIKVLSLQYEDIRQNLYETLKSIVTFLQLDRPESFLRDVEKAVQFENLQKEHRTKAGETKIWTDFGDNGRLPIYWKGCIGDWKNFFKVAQNEIFDAVYEKEIKEHGINLQFTYE